MPNEKKTHIIFHCWTLFCFPTAHISSYNTKCFAEAKRANNKNESASRKTKKEWKIHWKYSEMHAFRWLVDRSHNNKCRANFHWSRCFNVSVGLVHSTLLCMHKIIFFHLFARIQPKFTFRSMIWTQKKKEFWTEKLVFGGYFCVYSFFFCRDKNDMNSK